MPFFIYDSFMNVALKPAGGSWLVLNRGGTNPGSGSKARAKVFLYFTDIASSQHLLKCFGRTRHQAFIWPLNKALGINMLLQSLSGFGIFEPRELEKVISYWRWGGCHWPVTSSHVYYIIHKRNILRILWSKFEHQFALGEQCHLMTYTIT